MNFNILIFLALLSFQNSCNKETYLTKNCGSSLPVLRHPSLCLSSTSRSSILKTCWHSGSQALNWALSLGIFSLTNLITVSPFQCVWVTLKLTTFLLHILRVATHQHLPCITLFTEMFSFFFWLLEARHKNYVLMPSTSLVLIVNNGDCREALLHDTAYPTGLHSPAL